MPVRRRRGRRRSGPSRRPADPAGIVVSKTAQAQGLERGTIIILDRIGTELEVVGLTDGQATFGHVDVAYLPLGTWQLIAAGQAPEDGRPTADQVGAVDVDRACVVALQPSTARTWR